MVNGAFVVHLSFCAHQFKISFACCEDTAYLIIKLALEKASSCLLVYEKETWVSCLLDLLGNGLGQEVIYHLNGIRTGTSQ